MPNSTFSSREFNHDVGRAKKAAFSGPVFITDRGRPSHVLLTVDSYRRLIAEQPGIIDLLAMPEAADIEFEAPCSSPLFRPADLL